MAALVLGSDTLNLTQFQVSAESTRTETRMSPNETKNKPAGFTTI